MKILEEVPEYVAQSGGTLHPYQLEGVNCLRHLYPLRRNYILGDQSGLGKSVQAINAIYSLYKEGYTVGPFLVVTAYNDVTRWERELEFWAPELYTVSYVGTRESRTIIMERELFFGDEDAPKFHVLLTSFELIGLDYITLQAVDWAILVVDEFRHLALGQSKLFDVLSQYKSEYRLVLMDFSESWNSLVLSQILDFVSAGNSMHCENSSELIDSLSETEKCKNLKTRLSKCTVERRMKEVVAEIPRNDEFIVWAQLTPTQRTIYKQVLSQNVDTLACKDGATNEVSLKSVLIELNRCVNHPYLVHSASSENFRNGRSDFVGEILCNSGKLILLEKILRVVQQKGQKVAVLVHNSAMLDILEALCISLSATYLRVVSRSSIEEFLDQLQHTNDVICSVFLLTSRMASLCLNLSSLDYVIVFDTECDPSKEVHTLLLAHKVAQEKDAKIFRLVAQNTVEEFFHRVLEKKLKLLKATCPQEVDEKLCFSSADELMGILKAGSSFLLDDQTCDQIEEYDCEELGAMLCDEEELTLKQMASVGQSSSLYLTATSLASYSARQMKKKSSKTRVKLNSPNFWENFRIDTPAEADGTNTLEKSTEKASLNFTHGDGRENPTWNDFNAFSDLSDDDKEEPLANCGENSAPERQHEFSAKSDTLPPLLKEVDGETLVYGFNLKDRRSFQKAVLRWGMPPRDLSEQTETHWTTQDLKRKPNKHFKAYSSMFLRHLCQPATDKMPSFSDGVPREGIQRSAVLVRIAVMSLIKKKVLEFEVINSQLPKAKIFSVVDLTSLPQHTKGDGNSESDSSGSSEESVVSFKNSRQRKSLFSQLKVTQMEIQPRSLRGLHSENPRTRRGKLNKKKERKKHRKGDKIHFMFNIADGGFTELHSSWRKEEKSFNAAPTQKKMEVWNRRHDYFLLCGIAKHGYGHFQTIQKDKRCGVIKEPFRAHVRKPNYADVKKKFFLNRCKLLEQALTCEEQLRRASFLQSQSNRFSLPEPLSGLNELFADLENVSQSHKHLSHLPMARNKSAQAVLLKVLREMDKMLEEMESHVEKLPNKLKKMIPVTEKLRLSEAAILSSLVRCKPRQLVASSQKNKQPTEEEDIYVVQDTKEAVLSDFC